jgi:hypothetical protein
LDEQIVRQCLADALCDALFRVPGPVRLWSILDALGPAARMSAKVALELLKSDPRFEACETRWDLAHRAEISGRPLGGALEAILQAYGGPMPEVALLSELCLSKSGDPDDFRVLLERLLRGSREIGLDGERYYRTRWLVNTAAREEQRLLYLNGLDGDQTFIKALKKLKAPTLKGRTPLDTAEAVLKAYGQPLDNRALGLALWHHHDDRFVPAETLSAMMTDERFLLLSGPKWLAGPPVRTLQKAADKLRGEPEVPPTGGDLTLVLQAPPAQRMRLTEENSRAVLHVAQRSRVPVTMDELLTDVLQIRPKQRNYSSAAHALEELLNSDLHLARLQRGHYISRQAIPEWVRSVPPSLVPEVLPLGPREVCPDVVLRVDELEAGLAERVRSPLYEDQGDNDALPGDEAVESTRIAILYHHFRLGTMKLRLCDWRFFGATGPVTMVRFQSPDGVAFPVWVNTEHRLLYGLLSWYAAWLHPNGSLLTIERPAGDSDVYRLVYEDETDPGTYVGRERFAQLQELATRLRRRRAFLLDIVTELLHLAGRATGREDKGLAFDQLWSQVNLIRRTSRLQVASILSYYPQFHAPHGGRWTVAK